MDFFDSFEKLIEEKKATIAAEQKAIKSKQDEFVYESVFEENKNLKKKIKELESVKVEVESIDEEFVAEIQEDNIDVPQPKD